MLKYRLLESVSQSTLLGIRFWDPALNAQVKDGLKASIYRADNPSRRVYGLCTKSCNYVFNSIPGMHDVEARSSNQTSLSPPLTKQFVLEVDDTRGRFSSVALPIQLPLPYNGLFLVGDNSGSPIDQPQGFNLYSSINRLPSSQYIFVRGELLNSESGLAAANALVQVRTEDDFRWYGVSDADGKFAVMMPYPFLNFSFGSSPPTSDGVRLFQRTWAINLNVFYEPLAQEFLQGTQRPNYSSVLSQEQASIFTETPELDSGEVSDFQTDLVYGRDLIVKTAGFSQLYVSPIGSPA